MKIKFFDTNKIETLSDVKKQYKKLAMKHHPDLSSNDGEDMKIINNEYEYLFENYKLIAKNFKGETYTKKSTNENFNEFIDIVNVLIKVANVQMEICGTWLWIHGIDKTQKELHSILKALGCSYHSKKKIWYFAKDRSKKKTFKTVSHETVREHYGSEFYNRDEKSTGNNLHQIGA